MAIAQLTHLHISIPASGAPPGEVPEDCFPHSPLSRGSADYFSARPLLAKLGRTQLVERQTSIHEVVGSSRTRRSNFSNLNLYNSRGTRA